MDNPGLPLVLATLIGPSARLRVHRTYHDSSWRFGVTAIVSFQNFVHESLITIVLKKVLLPCVLDLW